MENEDFRWRDTSAAKMLAAGLKWASEERNLSIRQIGKHLGYKQAVVLSHMAKGRVPIPIDRATDIAAILELNASHFLTAVVEQRHPDVDWKLIAASSDKIEGDPLARELAAIIGAPLSNLSGEQRRVIREVAADTKPARRWLSVHELPAILALRKRQPEDTDNGLSPAEIDEILASLGRKS